MPEDGSVLIKIIGDASEFTDGLDGAAKECKKLASEMPDAVGAAADAACNAFAKLGGEYSRSIGQVSAATGSTGAEIEALGKTAQKVYTNSFGNGLDDAAEGLEVVHQNTDRVNNRLQETVKSGDALQDALNGIAKKGAKFAAVGVAAVGTAAVAATGAFLSMGDQYNQSVNQISAATGATGAELEALGDTARKVYQNNFGESLNDVADGISVVRQNTGLMNDELQKATESGFALRDTFGYGMEESSRTASALMKNFGVSAEEAYNIIAVGAQNGADQNGDLLDTLNEYSAQYAALGLSADQFVGGLISGAEAGVFSIDKVGDAVKEFNIRAKDGSKSTVGAFQTLGLNADEMMSKFAQGGDTAQEAFFEVIKALDKMEDPVEKNAAAVALFGTQYEDLEKNVLPVLGSMEDGANKTYDALGQINEVKYDDFGSAMEGLKRTIEGTLIPSFSELASGPLMEIAETATEMVEQLADDLEAGEFDGFFDLIADGLDTVVDLIPKIGDAAADIFPIVEGIGEVVVDVLELALDNIDLVIGAVVGLGEAWAILNVAKVATTVMKGVKAFQTAETAILGLNTALEAMGIAITVSTGGLVAIGIAAAAAIAGMGIAAATTGQQETDCTTATEKLCDEYAELHDEVVESRKAREESAEAAGRETAVAEEYAKKLDALAGKENKSADEKQRMRYYTEKLNEILPDLKLEYDAEKDSLNKSTKAIKDNIEARKLQAKIDAYGDNYNSAVAEGVELEDERDKLRKQHRENLKAQARAQEEYDGVVKKSGEGWATFAARQAKAKKNLDEATAAVEESGAALDQNSRDLNENAAEQKNWSDKLDGALGTQALQKSLDELSSMAKEAGVKIPDSVAKGMESGKYAIPETVDGLKNLIKFDSAIQKAGLSGAEIPPEMASGILSGKISVEEAVAALKKSATSGLAPNGKAAKPGELTADEYAQGALRRKSNVNKAGVKVGEASIDGLSDGSKGSYSLGTEFTLGYAAGMVAKFAVQKVIQNTKKVFLKAFGAGQKAQDSHSPSRVTRDKLGVPFSQGIAVGIEDAAPDAAAAARKSVSGAIDAAKKGADNSAVSFSIGSAEAEAAARKAIADNAVSFADRARAAVQGEMGRIAASATLYSSPSAFPRYDDKRVVSLLGQLLTETQNGRITYLDGDVLGANTTRYQRKMNIITGR